MSDLVDRYLTAWNASDPTARRAALEQAFTADVRYVDPLVDVRGAEQLDATIAAVQGQFPGFVFSLLGEAEGHHDVVRFRWGLGPAGQEPVVEGSDVATVAADRISAVTGFLDKLPG